MADTRFDYISIKPAEITADGYLKAQSVISRSGVFVYHEPDGTVKRELRHPDHVFTEESLDSIKLQPITLGHPNGELVDANNYKEYGVGSVGEAVSVENNLIIANFVIYDAAAIQKVQSGEYTQLSLGYTVDLVEESGEFEGEWYDYVQTNLRYNHLALVRSARAGSVAKIHMDAKSVIATTIEDVEEKVILKEGENMSENLNKADAYEDKDKDKNEMQNDKGMNKDTDAMQKKIDELMKQIEKLEAERDDMKDKLDSMKSKTNNDSLEVETKINQVVAERLRLAGEAKTLAPEMHIKLDSDNSVDIKRSVLAQKFDSVDFSNKSDAYVNARWDLALEDLATRTTATANQREQAVGLSTKNVDSISDAKSKMFSRVFKKEA